MVLPQDRLKQLIALAAFEVYQIRLQQNQGGDPDSDWLNAEAEIMGAESDLRNSIRQVISLTSFKVTAEAETEIENQIIHYLDTYTHYPPEMRQSINEEYKRIIGTLLHQGNNSDDPDVSEHVAVAM